MTQRRPRLQEYGQLELPPPPPSRGFPVGTVVTAFALVVLIAVAYFLLPDTLPLGWFLLVAGTALGLALAAFLLAIPEAARRAELLYRLQHTPPAERGAIAEQIRRSHPVVRLPFLGETNARAFGVVVICLTMTAWWLSPWAPVGIRTSVLRDLTVPLRDHLLAAPLVMAGPELAVLLPPSLPPEVREAASRIDADSASDYDKALKAVAEGRHAEARLLLTNAGKNASDEQTPHVLLLAAQNEVYAGQFGDAIGAYTKLIQADRDDPMARCQLAAAALYAGQYDRAADLIEQGFRACALLSEDDPDGRVALAAYLHLQATREALLGRKSDQAEAQCVRAREILQEEEGEGHPVLSASLNNQAVLYMRRGNFAGAENLVDRTRDIWHATLGPNHPLTLAAAENLAILHYRSARYAEAADLLTPSKQSQADPASHAGVDDALRCHVRAMALRQLAQYEGARRLGDEALRTAEKTLGAYHPVIAAIVENQAQLDMAEAYYLRAEAGLLRAADILQRSVGAHHPATLAAWSYLAELALEQGPDRRDRAAALCRRVLDTPAETLGEDHPIRAAVTVLSGRLERLEGRPRAARRLLEEALAVQEAVFGQDHPVVAQTLGELAALDNGSRTYHYGVKRYQQAIEKAVGRLNNEHPDVARLRFGLAKLHAQQEHWEEAADSLQQALTIQENTLPAHHPDLAATLEAFAHVLRHRQPADAARADQMLARARQIRARHAEIDTPPH